MAGNGANFFSQYEHKCTLILQSYSNACTPFICPSGHCQLPARFCSIRLRKLPN